MSSNSTLKLKLQALRDEQLLLKPIYDLYIENWKEYIQPLQAKANKFIDNKFELDALEGIVQGRNEANQKYAYKEGKKSENNKDDKNSASVELFMSLSKEEQTEIISKFS